MAEIEGLRIEKGSGRSEGKTKDERRKDEGRAKERRRKSEGRAKE
jgi:hypothetical protein